MDSKDFFNFKAYETKEKKEEEEEKALNHHHHKPHRPPLLQERNVFDVITSPFHILKGFILFFSEFKKREKQKRTQGTRR